MSWYPAEESDDEREERTGVPTHLSHLTPPAKATMSTEMQSSTKEREALVVALAHIRWQSFGECRTPGHPYTPPTAADAVATIQAALVPDGTEGNAPVAEPDVRNTPFGKEAAKLADDYLALCRMNAELRERLEKASSAQELSDEQITRIWVENGGDLARNRFQQFARAVLAAAKAQGG